MRLLYDVITLRGSYQRRVAIVAVPVGSVPKSVHNVVHKLQHVDVSIAQVDATVA